jgi:hypothetical protein
VPVPGDYDDGEIGGKMIGKGNRSTRRKPAPMPLCPPQTPHAARTRTRAAAVGSQRLTAWATARLAVVYTGRCTPSFTCSMRDTSGSLPLSLFNLQTTLIVGQAVTKWVEHLAPTNVRVQFPACWTRRFWCRFFSNTLISPWHQSV